MDLLYTNTGIPMQESSLKDKTFLFLINLMGLRDQLRINHWQTTSYSEHKMTDKLIADLTDMIDSMGEYTLGALERPHIPTVNNTISDISIKNTKAVLKCLEEQTCEMIQEFKITEYEGMINFLGELDAMIKKYKYLSTLE